MTTDFIDVQLSVAGVAAAGEGGSIRIANAHFDYTFAPGATVRVLTSEWSAMLSKKSCQGASVLEVAPPPAPTQPKPVKPAAAPSAASNEVK